ncbi:MAG: hypothetical protein LBD29_04445 [Treponema sp.]|jgi:hypothetical protein|nr:hypothetical protein [Treponema sp.]
MFPEIYEDENDEDYPGSWGSLQADAEETMLSNTDTPTTALGKEETVLTITNKLNLPFGLVKAVSTGKHNTRLYQRNYLDFTPLGRES